MLKKTSFILFLILAVLSCADDPQITQDQENFQLKVFGGSALGVSTNDCCNALLAENDNLFLTGSINYQNGPDLFLIKTDKYGNEIEWSPLLLGTGSIEVGNAITIDNNKNIITAGYTQTAPNEPSDFYVVKTSPAGEEIWSKKLGEDKDEKAYSVNISSSNIYIAGYTEGIDFASKNRQGWVMALSENGDFIWSHDYGFNEVADELNSVSNIKDSLLLMGTTHSKDNINKSDVFLFILKKSTKGIENFTRLFKAGNETGVSAVYANSGDIFVLGIAQISSNINNVILWKLNEDLQLVGEKVITSTTSETPSAMILNDNTLVVVGTSSNQQLKENYLVYILDTNLDIISRNTYGSSGKGNQKGMAGTVVGKSIVIGGCISSGNSSKASIFKTPEIVP